MKERSVHGYFNGISGMSIGLNEFLPGSYSLFSDISYKKKSFKGIIFLNSAKR